MGASRGLSGWMSACCALMISVGPLFLTVGVLEGNPFVILAGAATTLTLVPLGVALFLTVRSERSTARTLASRGVAGSALILTAEPFDYDGETRHTLTLQVSVPGREVFTTSCPWGALGQLGLGDRIAVTVDPFTGDLAPSR